MKFLVALLAFVFLIAAPYVSAATLSVCPVGCNHTSIQAAVGNASDGDVISVGNGTYTEDLSVVGFNGLTIESVSGKAVTAIQLVGGVGIDINGGTDVVLGGSDGHGFTVLSGGATTFLVQLSNNPQGVDISYNKLNSSGVATMGVSIGAAGATNLLISGNAFYANDGDGSIWCPLGNGVNIMGNTFVAEGTIATGYAMEFSGLLDSVVYNNYINGYSMGVVLFHGEGLHNVNVTYNYVSNTINAFRIGEYKATAGTDGNLYAVLLANNGVVNSTTGIRIHPDGVHVLTPNITVTDNTFIGGFGYLVRNQHSTGMLFVGHNFWVGAIPNVSKFSGNVTYYPYCVNADCIDGDLEEQLAAFDGVSTTDFSAIGNWSNVSLVLDNSDGSITWVSPLNLAGSSLLFGNNVGISYRRISVASSAMPELNEPAVLTFKSTGFTSASEFVLLRNGAVCPPTICTSVSVGGGMVTVAVTQLSDYYLSGSGMNQVLTESGAGLGNFLSAITDPVVNIILGLGIIGGVLLVFFGIGSAIKGTISGSKLK